jgi:hypothetical protein
MNHLGNVLWIARNLWKGFACSPTTVVRQLGENMEPLEAKTRSPCKFDK